MARSRNRARINRNRLFKEQDGKCFYCDVDMYLRKDVTRKYFTKHRLTRATFDHIILRSQGGTYAKSNGVCACYKCNNVRDDMEQGLFIRNFDLIMAEWEKGNRRVMMHEGNVYIMQKQPMKKQAPKTRQLPNGLGRAAFLIAVYSQQIGETVEDLFLKNVYNNTYELVRDL